MVTPAGLGLAAGANSIWYGAFGGLAGAGALDAVSPMSPQPARNAKPLRARMMPLFMSSSVGERTPDRPYARDVLRSQWAEPTRSSRTPTLHKQHRTEPLGNLPYHITPAA